MSDGESVEAGRRVEVGYAGLVEDHLRVRRLQRPEYVSGKLVPKEAQLESVHEGFGIESRLEPMLSPEFRGTTFESTGRDEGQEGSCLSGLSRLGIFAFL